MEDYQEMIVTGTDLRGALYEFPQLQKENIMQCIGKLLVSYRNSSKNMVVPSNDGDKSKFVIKNIFCAQSIGTGTIFKVTDNKQAFILTAAHNIRLKIRECIHCNIYYLKSKTCKIDNCKTPTSQKILKPYKTEFITEKTEKPNDYGQAIDRKQCDEFFIDEASFEVNGGPRDGYDIAILSIDDPTCFYKSFCETLELEIMTKDKLQALKSLNISWNLFGYPGIRPEKYVQQNICQDGHGMFGMQSVGNDYQIELRDKTRKLYIKQRVIDTSAGQSGSCLWYKANTKTKIFAVHTGGSIGNEEEKEMAYNVALIFDEVLISALGRLNFTNYYAYRLRELYKTIDLLKLQNDSEEQKNDEKDVMELKQELKITDVADPNSVYSICDLSGRYIYCVRMEDGVCAQKSSQAAKELSLFSFSKQDNDFYNIRTELIGTKRYHYWLGFRSGVGSDGSVGTVGVFEGLSGCWKLIPVDNKLMTFKIECYFNDQFKGYLGYQAGGIWNRLYNEKSRACVYRLELRSFESVVKDGFVYAIGCLKGCWDEKYLSYRWDGFCDVGYEKKNSMFKFVKAEEENSWYIQNKYNDRRLDHWLSYKSLVESGFRKVMALYKNKSDRSKWKLMPIDHKRMHFKIKCYYYGEEKAVEINTYSLEDCIFKLEEV
eukprot:519800_1